MLVNFSNGVIFSFLACRKYGGPPPKWTKAEPGNDNEVVCSQIPVGVKEAKLVPMFLQCGAVYDFRLMTDPASGISLSYAFITFVDRISASNAIEKVRTISFDMNQNMAIIGR